MQSREREGAIWGENKRQKNQWKDYYNNLFDKMKLTEMTSQKLIAVATHTI